MYQVKIKNGPNDPTGIVIHSSFSGNLKISSGVISFVSEGISDFNFTINPMNPGWNNIRPLVTLIEVTDSKKNKVIFNGRVLKPVQKMTSEGMFTVSYVCEDRLGYLNDSNQRHGEYKDITIESFFGTILENHNRQVEPHKRFKRGNVTVTNTTDNVYRYLGYEKTFATIRDKLIDRLGGFLRIRDEPDGMYLDYLKEVGEMKKTPIRLRSNLKDMQREINPNDIISRLIPLGARIESEDETATDASQARISISTVNNGKDYIDDVAMIAEFGIIEGSVVWDDVQTPEIVLVKGNKFLEAQKAAKVSYQVTPINVDLIDERFEAFELDNWYPIQNPVFVIDEPLQIIGQQIDILHPHKAILTIGEKYRTLTEYQVEANKKMKSITNLENQIGRLSSSNIQLKNNLKSAKKELDEIQQSLFDIDVSNLPAELQGISAQILGLQNTIGDIEQAVNGIPVYGPANSTKDGLLISELYMKLVSIQLATQEIDGLMKKEDKKKIDLITITQPINMDELINKITALENR